MTDKFNIQYSQVNFMKTNSKTSISICTHTENKAVNHIFI